MLPCRLLHTILLLFINGKVVLGLTLLNAASRERAVSVCIQIQLLFVILNAHICIGFPHSAVKLLPLILATAFNNVLGDDILKTVVCAFVIIVFSKLLLSGSPFNIGL